jgi:hypothetical protein
MARRHRSLLEQHLRTHLWPVRERDVARISAQREVAAPRDAPRVRAALLADFQRLLQQGVLLAWPTLGALTPVHRVGYQKAAALG